MWKRTAAEGRPAPAQTKSNFSFLKMGFGPTQPSTLTTSSCVCLPVLARESTWIPGPPACDSPASMVTSSLQAGGKLMGMRARSGRPMMLDICLARGSLRSMKLPDLRRPLPPAEVAMAFFFFCVMAEDLPPVQRAGELWVSIERPSASEDSELLLFEPTLGERLPLLPLPPRTGALSPLWRRSTKTREGQSSFSWSVCEQ
mmetsp:Transcript_20295/g.77694  ORF Transcript_20295/g.77694 Transcript_20295/m.77694 type:complete len:201 (-) Transcript_20295:1096-1698(-)